MNAQTNTPLPYSEIPANPDVYHGGAVMGRFLDGLGYRYYWATESIRQIDLDYRPSEGAQSYLETIQHIHNLTKAILNAALKKPNVRGGNKQEPTLTFEALRAQTLDNINQASEAFKAVDSKDLAEHRIIFQRGDQSSEIPVWNLMNGQIADALYHVGQLVSFRRTSGNPMNPAVNVFMGKNRK